MIFDPFQGDPKLTLGPDGAGMTFKGGQPVMDQGLENLVLIALFTRRNWCGNAMIENEDEKIGSDFETACDQPITLQALNDIRDAAEKALVNKKFKSVTVEVFNPKSALIKVDILISNDKGEAALSLEKSGAAWVMQASNPAYKRA